MLISIRLLAIRKKDVENFDVNHFDMKWNQTATRYEERFVSNSRSFKLHFTPINFIYKS